MLEAALKALIQLKYLTFEVTDYSEHEFTHNVNSDAIESEKICCLLSPLTSSSVELAVTTSISPLSLPNLESLSIKSSRLSTLLELFRL